MSHDKQTETGLRCHDAGACALGQLPCPSPKACGCAADQQPAPTIQRLPADDTEGGEL